MRYVGNQCVDQFADRNKTSGIVSDEVQADGCRRDLATCNFVLYGRKEVGVVLLSTSSKACRSTFNPFVEYHKRATRTTPKEFSNLMGRT